jgi:hypothetical protein
MNFGVAVMADRHRHPSRARRQGYHIYHHLPGQADRLNASLLASQYGTLFQGLTDWLELTWE